MYFCYFSPGWSFEKDLVAEIMDLDFSSSIVLVEGEKRMFC